MRHREEYARRPLENGIARVGQLSLFDAVQKSAEPETSLLPPAKITLNGVRVTQKRVLLAWMETLLWWGSSAEIATAGSFDRQNVMRRLPDLETDGFVERLRDANGADVLRRCLVIGALCICWRSISAGRAPRNHTQVGTHERDDHSNGVAVAASASNPQPPKVAAR
jgi:hypothetical protein